MTTIFPRIVPMNDQKEGATHCVAQVITILTETESSVVAVMCEFGLMKIERIQIDKLTQQILHAGDVYQVYTNV